jgi:replication-associated recombination protein RarA
MDTSESQDPWTKIRTRHDLPVDEVISALQKEIRRGKTENAVLLAYEMLTTSSELEAKLWQRLLVISVEDIGWGDLNATTIVNALYQMHLNPGLIEGDRFLFAIHAVRFLCVCQKDRSSSELLSWLKVKVEKEGTLPDIPDYAIDRHTFRGQQMGRGTKHFLAEGAVVNPELPGREKKYREYLLKLLNDK